MSEYQEAKETIMSNYPPENYTMLREALDLAMSLLNKETPMKVTKNIECPVCGMYAQRVCRGVHTPAKRCVDEDCNQKLDWSVDDD